MPRGRLLSGSRASLPWEAPLGFACIPDPTVCRVVGSCGTICGVTLSTRTADELIATLPTLDAAPREIGSLSLIVCRPAVDVREILVEGDLDPAEGLVGDNWRLRPSSRTPDRSPHPDMQLNVINSRVASFLAFGDIDRQAQAGDQLHVDLDLSEANLPVGTLLVFGSRTLHGSADADGSDQPAPTIVVTEQPHTGCAKFIARFGEAAMRFVNGPHGRTRRLRGLNARVVAPGRIRAGDTITVIRPDIAAD